MAAAGLGDSIDENRRRIITDLASSEDHSDETVKLAANPIIAARVVPSRHHAAAMFADIVLRDNAIKAVPTRAILNGFRTPTLRDVIPFRRPIRLIFHSSGALYGGVTHAQGAAQP